MSVRVFLLAIVLIICACSKNETSLLRPHQYPKISYPQRSFTNYTNEECPFNMNIPTYTFTEQKEYLFEEIPAGQCWFDINYPQFNAKIHCSYYNINRDHNFESLVNDAFTMASKHNIKASFREEILIENDNNCSGIIFHINGPVASPYQFFVSDSINHFLRGSLYFNTQVNIDSVAPIVDFIGKDIEVMLGSIKWK